ncbi:hypothetical protein M8C21_012985 [Ambrosia artemisiifolia]|uniref:Cytochrome P450 n=1 Tax=Ambrosia artemisiifolia TaxID=4212 RepID=A0AAD5BQH8_AMBAR|nr:hypothetical protein M8C21_012985 [Ambrosia artemisiifolia]
MWEVRNEALVVTSLLVILGSILWYKLKVSNGAPPLPPGPISLPIVGYLPFVSPDFHTQLANMAQTYGPIFKFKLGSKLHIVVNTLELAKEVVRDQDEIFSNRDKSVAASVLTKGGQDIAFSDNNANWRKLRKISVHEMLSTKSLLATMSVRHEEVTKTVKNVFGKIGTKVSMRTIAFATETSVLSRTIWERVARDMEKQREELHKLFATIVEDRIKSNLKISQDEGENDFLQILLNHKDEKDGTTLNLHQIQLLLLDIMIAGTETTASTIEWAMASIIENPNIMKKVQDELAEIVGLNNMLEEYHLPKLQYLDATIKETLRLFPTVPFLLPRSPSKTCTVGGYTVPKGCTTLVNVWSIQRDARYWDNPLEFNPDRFLANNKFDFKGTNVLFMPFGSGRRLCPGVPLAEKMLMLTVGSLMHAFDWSFPKDEKHDLKEIWCFAVKKETPLIVIPHQRLPDASLYM